MDFQPIKRDSFALAGIRIESEFPGWDRKAEWLSSAFLELDKRLAGLSGIRTNAKYCRFNFEAENGSFEIWIPVKPVQ